MASAITVICLLLFIAYSLSPFIRHQSCIVALANFVANGGATDVSYDIPSVVWTAALLGTLLSVIPSLLLLHTFHFPIYMKGMALLPSYVALGLMTGIGPRSAYATWNYIPVIPAAILLLISLSGILYSQMYHEDRGEHASFSKYLAGNVLLSCIGIIFCISLTNTDRQLHLQQPLARTIHHNDHSYANSIAPGEKATNNTITALRILSLSKQGIMADKLFSISGLGSSRCLLPDSTPSALIYHSPRLVYNHLQAIPLNFNGNVTAFLQKAIEKRMLALQDSTATHADSLRARPLTEYYLCALLLDRDLPAFANALPRFRSQEEALPKHYREALSLYYATDTLATRFVSDSIMDSIYLDYTRLRHSVKNDAQSRRRICTENYPATYWNYYFFSQDGKHTLTHKSGNTL